MKRNRFLFRQLLIPYKFYSCIYSISRCAKVPPLFPCLETIPIAFVVSIHLDGESVNELEPASNINGVEFDPFEIRII